MFVYCVAIAIQRPSGEVVPQALAFEEEHDARTLERRINEEGERMQKKGSAEKLGAVGVFKTIVVPDTTAEP